MTKTQAEIIEMIALLPLRERREVVELIQSRRLLEATFYERMTPEQRLHLQEGIAQAERGEGEAASVVLDRLSKRLDISSP